MGLDPISGVEVYSALHLQRIIVLCGCRVSALCPPLRSPVERGID